MATDNSAFLSLFWDLANDDPVKRLSSASQIIEYIRKREALFAINHSHNDGEIAADTDYTLKRLIRGLGSSRDSARHGFATCLCELLSLQSIPIKYSITQIEELTKVKGSMKPIEQRDLVFGKLFAYLAMIRSGRLASASKTDSEIVTIVLQKLLQLHEKKEWLREVATETLLSFISVLPAPIVVTHVFPALRDSSLLPEHSLAEYSAWQLLLALGIEKYAYENAVARESALQLLPTDYTDTKIFTVENLPLLVHGLVNAAARFPKIHKVWDYCLGEIFGLDGDRVLLQKRLSSLGKYQEQLLQALVQFLDSHFLTSSHERRSVAFHLSISAVRLCPVELIPVALSKACVRHLVAARTDKKKVLYSLAGGMIQDLVTTAGTDEQSRVALANCLVRYGGANFDSEVGVPAVRGLLEGLGDVVIISHVRFLGGIIAASATPELRKLKKNASSKRKRREQDMDDDEESEEQLADSSAVASIDALAGLVGNTSLSSRGQLCPIVLAMLIRIACFSSGKTAPPANEKAKKGSKGTKDNKKPEASAFSSLHAHLFDCEMLAAVQLIDCIDCQYPEVVAHAAASKLLSLLATTGGMTAAQLTAQGEGKAEKRTNASAGNGPSFIQQATAVTAAIASCSIPLLKLSGEEVDDEEESPSEVLAKVLEAVKVLGESSSSLAAPLSTLLQQMLFQVIAPSQQDEDILEVGILSELTSASLALVAAAENVPVPSSSKTSAPPATQSKADKKGKGEKASKAATAPSPSTEESPLEELQLDLLGYCIKALSLHQSSRGIRTAVKEAWSVIGRETTINPSLIKEVMGVVTGAGNDDEDEEEEEEDEDDEDEDEDDDEEEDEDEDDNDEPSSASNVIRSANFSQLTDEGSKARENVEDADSEDEDDSDGEGGKILQHDGSAEADAALAAMIDLRRKSRKQHQLEAQRRELAWRARVVDILEVCTLFYLQSSFTLALLHLTSLTHSPFLRLLLLTQQVLVHRMDNTEILLSIISDSLACLRTLQQPSMMGIPEGRSLEVRVRVFMEQKLLKKALSIPDKEKGKSECSTSAIALLNVCKDHLLSTQSSLYITVRMALLALCKMAANSSNAALKKASVDVLLELQEVYFSKKNRNVLGAYGPFIEEVFSKLGDVAAKHLLQHVVSSIGAAKSHFLRAEACKIYTGFLTRASKASLTDETKQAVIKSVPGALGQLGGALAALGETGAALAKLARPLLTGAKDMLTVVIGSSGSSNTTVPAAMRTSLTAAVSMFSTSPSPVVTTLASQVLALLEQLQGAGDKRDRSDSAGSGSFRERGEWTKSQGIDESAKKKKKKQ